MRGHKYRNIVILALYTAFTLFVFGFNPDRKGVGPLPMQTIVCEAREPFTVDIRMETAEIAYDFSKSKAELTAKRGETLRRDQATAGLRSDRPQFTLEALWGRSFHPLANAGCAWYKNIVLTVSLKPQIYIASELASETCVAAVIEHELGHVKIDREILNEYSAELRAVIQSAAAKTNPMGPVPFAVLDEERQIRARMLKQALDDWLTLFEKEMAWRQDRHDSPQEYARISKICRYGMKW